MANYHMVNALSMNIKDSRWLQLEVCREYQRNKCSRSDTECKFAHPLAHVEVQNGKVTACFDSIKGRCNREKPPCKYFHPPQHLKEQLLINGRNNLAIKNALVQQFTTGSLPMPGAVPVNGHGEMVLAYAAGAVEMTSPTAQMYSLPPSMSQFYTAAPTQAVGEAGMVAPLAMPQLQQKMQRSDRLESEPALAAALDAGRKRPRDADDLLGEPAYDAQLYFGAFPGMGVAYKRSAGDKAGLPCYGAAGAASYPQLMLHQQPGYLHQTPCEYPAEQERPASGHSAASAPANGGPGAASPPAGSSGGDSGEPASCPPVTASAGLSSTVACSVPSLPAAVNPALYTGYSISKAALPAAAGGRPLSYPLAAAGAGAAVALPADQLLMQQQQQLQLQAALQQQQTQQRLLMQQRLLLQQQQQQQLAASPYLPQTALYAAQPAALSTSSPYLAMGASASAAPYFAMAGYGQPGALASQQQLLAGAAPAQTGLAAAAYAQIQNGEPALKRMRKM